MTDSTSPSHVGFQIWYGMNSRLNIFRAAMILLTIISALRISFNLGYNLGTFEHSQLTHRSCCINFEESFLISIVFGLLVTSVGLLIRRPISLTLSMLGLVWVVVVYVLWYRGTLAIIRNSEVGSFYNLPNQSQHLLPLNGATWWDILVLAIVVALLFWHIKILIPFVKRWLASRQFPTST